MKNKKIRVLLLAAILLFIGAFLKIKNHFLSSGILIASSAVTAYAVFIIVKYRRRY